MATEIEAKFRMPGPQPLRTRLAQLGAECLGQVFEVNRILDTPERRLLSAGCGLRVRECGAVTGDMNHPVAALTLKGPRTAGELKSRAELETAIADAAAACAILRALGYDEVIVYEKRRETWRLGTCTVTLDELPRLGWFVEIEGPDAAAVQSVRRQLNLADAAPIPETYVELAARHGDADPHGPRRLHFVPGESR